MGTEVQPGLRVLLVGMASGALLATVKLVAGLVGHSYALVADAVESFADIASSAVVWSGLAISVRPPDEEHPYGHGKAEPLAAMAVGLMLIGAAVGIVVQAVHGIGQPHKAPAAFTLIVLILVVVIKETLFRVSSRLAKLIDSTALGAEAWHHRSDAITSIIAAVGITVSLYAGPGYEGADDWAAILASGVIAFNGARFTRRALHELMDAQPDKALLSEVSSVAGAVPGVRGVEKVLARKMGTTYLIDMHVEVDGAVPVREAHELAHRVKDAVRGHNRSVADVLVHIEPYERDRSGRDSTC